MTQFMKLSLARPLRGLRPRAVPVEEIESSSASVEWIFALRERARDEARRGAAVQTCLEGIERAVASITEMVDRRLDEVAGLATELGLALAKEVVGSALEKDLVDPTPTVRRCLRDLSDGADSPIAVFLAPADLDHVLDELANEEDPRERAARARFAADPELNPGSVRVETGAGRLLYDPAEVLARICDEVRREIAG